MDEIERYLDRVCRGVAGSRSLREHLREELGEHLRESARAHEASGASPPQAALLAIEEFGRAEELAHDLQGVYGRRVVSLLIDAAMRWKEVHMKRDWRWQFTAHAAVVFTVGLSVLFVLFCAVFILPLLNHKTYILALDPVEDPTAAWMATLTNSVRAVFDWWFAWIPLIVLAGALFEWRFRDESKATARLAIGTALSLAASAAALLAAGVMLIHAARLPVSLRGPRLEIRIAEATLQARRAFGALESATNTGSWSDAFSAGEELGSHLRFLEQNEGALPWLAAWDRRAEVREIRRLLEEASEASRSVSHADSLMDSEAARALIPRLAEAYEKLRAAVPGWDTAGGETPAPGSGGSSAPRAGEG